MVRLKVIGIVAGVFRRLIGVIFGRWLLRLRGRGVAAGPWLIGRHIEVWKVAARQRQGGDRQNQRAYHVSSAPVSADGACPGVAQAQKRHEGGGVSPPPP